MYVVLTTIIIKGFSVPVFAQSSTSPPPLPGCTTTLNPRNSIEQAIKSASPGDTICLSAGQYYETVDTGSISGKANNLITIRSVSGNPKDVTVNGGRDMSDTNLWTQSSGNIYYATGIGWRIRMVSQCSTGGLCDLPQDWVPYGPGQVKKQRSL